MIAPSRVPDYVAELERRVRAAQSDCLLVSTQVIEALLAERRSLREALALATGEPA